MFYGMCVVSVVVFPFSFLKAAQSENYFSLKGNKIMFIKQPASTVTF